MPIFFRRAPLLTSLVVGVLTPLVAHATSIEELGWTDKQYMAAQVANVDQMVRDEFGGQLRQTPADLDYLQRIINRGLIERSDTRSQQALGMVLGNVLAAKTGMQWYVYKDEKGRSRALCVPSTENCLFPVTMLSRRMAVGLYPDVDKIYREALKLVEPVLPKNPYEQSPKE